MAHRSGLVLEKIEKTVGKTDCKHYWLIEPALGPTSKGICKYCGQSRVFLNIVEENQPKEDLSRFFGKGETEGEGEDADESEEKTDH